MKKIILLLALIGSGFIGKSAAKINGVFKLNDNRSINVFLKEIVPAGEKRKAYEQNLDIGQKRTFSMQFSPKQAGFYSLSIVMENEQRKSAHNSVIYLSPDTKLDLEFRGKERFGIRSYYEKMRNTDNKALLEIRELYNEQLIDLFKEAAAPIQQRENLKAFYDIAEKVIAKQKLSPEVKKYIQFNAFDTYNTNLYRLALDNNRGSKANVPLADGFYIQPADPLFYFNDPMILQFQNGVSNVIRYLEVHSGSPVYKSRKSLAEINTLVTLLKTKVKNELLVDKVLESLLNGFSGGYRIGSDFEKDLQQHSAVADQIKELRIRSSVKKNFGNLRYTMVGAPLPPVKFQDATGETHSLDQFKGKYLFIDLWASWCVPCIKMTPYVQQLEKEYEGKNINFVAISIDGNKQDWLNKMKTLNLHGHHFLDQSSSFAKGLNVSGIPHYLIYDPEGKLVVYKAEMPDNPKLKEKINQLLGL